MIDIVEVLVERCTDCPTSDTCILEGFNPACKTGKALTALKSGKLVVVKKSKLMTYLTTSAVFAISKGRKLTND